jgi:hypothetical protein
MIRKRIFGDWIRARGTTSRYPPEQVLAAIKQTHGNVSGAGKLLGASYRSMWVAIGLIPGAAELVHRERQQARVQRALRQVEAVMLLHHGIPYGDHKITLAQAATITGLSQLTICKRIKAGLSPADIMRAPPDQPDEPIKKRLYSGTFSSWRTMMLDYAEDQIDPAFRTFGNFLVIAGERPSCHHFPARRDARQPIGPANFLWDKPAHCGSCIDDEANLDPRLKGLIGLWDS